MPAPLPEAPSDDLTPEKPKRYAAAVGDDATPDYQPFDFPGPSTTEGPTDKPAGPPPTTKP